MTFGTVKNFGKSYGFITDRESRADVFVHGRTLKAAGFDCELMIPGAAVEFKLEQSHKGLRATKIISINGKSADGHDIKSTAAIKKPLLPVGERAIGSLKFYNAVKKYGFLEIPGYADIFFHQTAVEDQQAKKLLETGKAQKGQRFEFVSREYTQPGKASDKDSPPVASIMAIATAGKTISLPTPEPEVDSEIESTSIQSLPFMQSASAAA